MRIRVPFKVRSRSEAYESQASREQIHEAYQAAKTRDVPLSLLRATQHTVGSERLMQYASNPDTLPHNGDPIIIERGGRYYIHNGHHRSTLASMRGDRTVRAKVAHLGPLEPRQFGRPGELLMMPAHATSVSYQAHDVEDVAEVIDGGIAVLNIETPLEDKPGNWWSFFDDYESIFCRFANAIESDDVRGVLIKGDSPGGTASGLNELVDAMLRLKAKTRKPVWTYADEGMYSAAFAIACVGDKIFLPRAGGLGSVGVVSQMVSVSENNRKNGVDYRVYTSGARKADGNPNLPISSGAEAHVQRRVDQLAKIFWKLVASERHVSRSFVRSLEADTFYGKDAVRQKLADGVCSLETCVSEFRKTLDGARTTIVTSPGKSSTAPKPKAERSEGMLPEQERVNKATKALARAEGSKAKAAALTEFNSSSAALAKALSKPQAGKHSKKTETIDISSPSPSGSSGSSASASSASASASAESMSAVSGSAASAASGDEKALAAAAKKITGKTSAKDAIGALLAMGENSERTTKSERRIAKLEGDRASAKINALIAQGKIDCKVTPGNEKKLRALAKDHGYRALRSFLSAASPAVLPEVQDAPLDADVEAVKLSAADKKILAKMGVDESMHGRFSKYMARRDAERAGKVAPERGMPRDLVQRGKVTTPGDEE